MPTLFDIHADLSAMLDLLDETQGEITADIEPIITKWWADLELTRDQKLDGYAMVIREAESRAAARRAERDRLEMRVRVDERIAVNLKERLKMFFSLQGLKKVETNRFKISLAGNGGKAPMDVEGEALSLPEQYRRVEISVDKEKIRADLEAGIELPFAKLLPRGNHISIR